MKANSIQRVRKLMEARFRNSRQAILLTLIAGFTVTAIGQPLQLASVLDP
jgi:hypothetical protein